MSESDEPVEEDRGPGEGGDPESDDLLPLEDALDRGARVRVLTTDYLAITDPDALTQLADLAEGGDRRLQVRLFGGGSVAFHPKAYIFWSSAGEAAAGYDG